MRVHYIAEDNPEKLSDLSARFWSKVSRETLKLTGTPASMQPSASIRNTWADKPTGVTEQVEVSVVHNGSHVAFRLEWADSTYDGELVDNSSFPDAAAILLPVVPNAPLITMGITDLPVNGWYWRADDKGFARQITCQGLGTSKTLDLDMVTAQSNYSDDRWSVIIMRALKVDGADHEGKVAQLEVGSETGFGVTVWEGSQAERGGIKAYSGPAWLPLNFDALIKD